MVIIAGSIGADDGNGGTISTDLDLFQQAGTGARLWYLTALGYRDRAPDHTGKQYLWSGTSFSAPAISGAVALLGAGLPQSDRSRSSKSCSSRPTISGPSGSTMSSATAASNIAGLQADWNDEPCRQQEPVSTTDNGELPPASGDANTGQSLGAIILDGYDRAFVLDLAKTLRKAEASRPLSRAIIPASRSTRLSAGPLTLAMTVAQRRDLPQGFALERMGIGPEDARKSRLIAGAAIARIDNKTAAAFGFAEGAKAMERRLSGAAPGAFLIAKDIAGDPGLSARREGSVAMRRNLGPVG
jgi:hypothetical protein